MLCQGAMPGMGEPTRESEDGDYQMPLGIGVNRISVLELVRSIEKAKLVAKNSS